MIVGASRKGGREKEISGRDRDGRCERLKEEDVVAWVEGSTLPLVSEAHMFWWGRWVKSSEK